MPDYVGSKWGVLSISFLLGSVQFYMKQPLSVIRDLTHLIDLLHLQPLGQVSPSRSVLSLIHTTHTKKDQR